MSQSSICVTFGRQVALTNSGTGRQSVAGNFPVKPVPTCDRVECGNGGELSIQRAKLAAQTPESNPSDQSPTLYPPPPQCTVIGYGHGEPQIVIFAKIKVHYILYFNQLSVNARLN